ncbi:dual specificity protein phosphatase 1B isoform X1 [Brachypodium distachyon]|uniref:dual specificity protein phosphatase 1B isoform X1 n=1 Tax=Brachypodium distachyon TaxID=15368 RepID=UPI000D0E3055|nr:dual specificity protein phosphatase 1B isoform X1 [Brachypodium distachyon]|eukprot:XP_024315620.1 dual specificity protein phosphatase 1B isoform X1 [Brachypodium distachyon]
MSVPEAGQSSGRDEREREDYEKQQSRVLMALMQGFCAARYRKADNTPCLVDQGLYLGSVGAALNKEALKSLNITHILIVARSLNPAFSEEFTYKKIEVLDSPDTDLVKHFGECFNFIDEGISTGGNVLVHCFAGRSRSVTVVLAYLMKKHQVSLESALSLVRSKRPQASPNEGFMAQLVNFEKSLQGEEEWYLKIFYLEKRHRNPD